LPRAAAQPGASRSKNPGVRTLAVVFGDQLDWASPALSGLDPTLDAVLMMEAADESRRVPSHIQRTVLFLSAMRHFAQELEAKGLRVIYSRLEDPQNTGTFAGEFARAVRAHNPERVVCVRPGEWGVLREVESWRERFGLRVDVLEDPHFFTTPDEFAAWAKGRRSLTMEYFYREQRRKTGYLMQGKGPKAQPEGGEWNYDASNRLAFGPKGPSPAPPTPARFAPDAITREVIAAVRTKLPGLPGVLERDEDFAWPVSRRQALGALLAFVRERLPLFGPYEDAMWSTAPSVYHAVLSPALNLKLLNPRECCEAAIAAYEAGKAPLQSVEAFVRQLIGWREFIRGVYWLEGPQYARRNSLQATGTLPDFYWTGKTEMNCLRTCIGQVVSTSYGHHIQRLMVTGNFALLAGVHPKAISDWYLGMYADGVDWVTLPNTLGMAMHADARPDSAPGVTGLVGTKPYAASGRYISKMSDYCKGCKYNPARREGPDACPFTVFYWDFLIRHRTRLGKNQRMAMILKNVDAMTPAVRTRITIDASAIREKIGVRPAVPTP
jgi:deoxyribodipyrimidine photolyase-related protein